MNENFNYSDENLSHASDLQVFAAKTKSFFANIVTSIRSTIIPKLVKVFYKLSILRDIEAENTFTEEDAEYSLKLVSASNHAKQLALLDMAVFTSPEFQECIIEEKTLKEMVIEFQVVKSKLYVENRSANGNFIYEGALVEQIAKHFESMTDVLKKIYIDFFKMEVYQYHCSSVLDISFHDLYDETWLDKVAEKLSNYNSEEIVNAEYPAEVLNKFKFIYMLIKIQEIKYDAIAKIKCQE